MCVCMSTLSVNLVYDNCRDFFDYVRNESVTSHSTTSSSSSVITMTTDTRKSIM